MSKCNGRQLMRAVEVKVAKLEMKPGDKLLFKLPRHISAEDAAEFGRQVQKQFPDITIIVIPDMIDVSIISPPQATPPAPPGVN